MSLEIVANSNIYQNISNFLLNKLNFCCRNYSRSETIKGNTLCKNLTDSLQLMLSLILNQGAQKIESAVKATGNGLEYVGKRLNLFNALNNIAKLKSKVPNYVLVQTGQLQPAKQQQTGTI